jgi:hypothetical protein
MSIQVCQKAQREVRKCVHALHVIVARKLLGQAAVSILMKRSLVLPNKIAAPAKDIYLIYNEKMVN